MTQPKLSNEVIDFTSRIIQLREQIPISDASLLSSGGGDGTSGDMDARVKALEDKYDKIDGKLDKLIDSVHAARLESVEINATVKSMPTAMQFGELKGRVDSLPTMTKISALVGVVVAATGLILRWPEISTFVASHLTR